MEPPEAVAELKEYANGLPSVQLSERSICDLEMLATGRFSPLDRFMGREDHQSVLDDMRLASGHLFSIPVALPVQPGPAIRAGQDLALRDSKNDVLAVMALEDVYEWDREEVGIKALGTTDPRHPLVAEMHRWGKLNISGRLQVLQLPRRSRLPGVAPHSGPDPGQAQGAGPQQRRRLSDPQPAASCSRGADQTGGAGGRRSAVDPSGSRADQAGRRRSLHPCEDL